MSQAGTINHDTAARLLGITPGELESLVKSGAVRRADRNVYHLPVLVQDYIGHLKDEHNRVEFAPKQSDIAAHLDMSDRAVREFLDAAGIDQRAATLTSIRIAYIRRQREIAAGRATEGGIDLATERARLAREQADKIAMQNAVTRRELAPTYLLEEVLSAAAARVAAILDAIPGAVRRRNQNLTAADIETIASEIAKARNIAASMTLDDLVDSAVDIAATAPLEAAIE